MSPSPTHVEARALSAVVANVAVAGWTPVLFEAAASQGRGGERRQRRRATENRWSCACGAPLLLGRRRSLPSAVFGPGVVVVNSCSSAARGTLGRMTREEALTRLQALGLRRMRPRLRSLRRGGTGGESGSRALTDPLARDPVVRPHRGPEQGGRRRLRTLARRGALGYLALAAVCDAVLAAAPTGTRLVVAESCFPTGRARLLGAAPCGGRAVAVADRDLSAPAVAIPTAARR